MAGRISIVDAVSEDAEAGKDGTHLHNAIGSIDADAEILIFFAGGGVPSGLSTAWGTCTWRPAAGANQNLTSLWQRAASDRRAGMFALLNPTTGAGDIILDRGHSHSVNWVSQALTIKGAKMELPSGGQIDSGTSRSQSTVSGAMGMMFDCAGWGGYTGSPSPDAGQTKLEQTFTDSSGVRGMEIATSYKEGGGGTMGWDQSFVAHGAVLFEERAGANSAIWMMFENARSKWDEIFGGLAAPKDRDKVWRPEPQILTPTAKQTQRLAA